MCYRLRFAQIHMGVRFTITCYAVTREAGEAACRAAFARIAELDDVMSDYRPASELMRLCARAGRGPVEVSDDLFAVLNKAQEFAELSGGGFDVTCGALTRLWRESREASVMPGPAAINEALRRCGYRNLILREETLPDPLPTSRKLDATLPRFAREGRGHTAELLAEGMHLDLGGIGKGYACDEGLAVLGQYGISSALIEAGGEIAMSGPPPQKRGWLVSVAGLFLPPAQRRTPLCHCAISTSGDAEQHLDADGKRYSHVLDPRTGQGLVDSGPVTVVAPSATVSDALAKVCAMLPPGQSEATLERYGARRL